jgi:hypothetical protein
VSGGGERIELRLPSGLAFGPFGFDPALLLETVECWIEGALLHLQDFAGDRLDAFGNCPAVAGFDRKCFEDQKIESSLDEVAWLSHTMIIYTMDCRSSRYMAGESQPLLQ